MRGGGRGGGMADPWLHVEVKITVRDPALAPEQRESTERWLAAWLQVVLEAALPLLAATKVTEVTWIDA